ncbi:hypothetical protein IWQ60_007507 [Tieghemiomyces parasiticus]|uniref:Neurochondrin-domain-containing protein n=1 Tax=Tieghemiomyces parasiticus TaxID=78921 RepID=A0A9W8A537_9FUNG|nr:hypothetical protein IWQ60_007507 [Tieghemiomyces parasiticus]
MPVESFASPTESAPPAALEQCLALLGPRRSDEEKFAGLLLLTKVVEPQDEAALERILEAIDPRFLGRLVSATGEDARAYQDLAVAIVSSFAAHPRLLGHPSLTTVVPGLARVLTTALAAQDHAHIHELLPLVAQFASVPAGLAFLVKPGATLVPQLAALLLSDGETATFVQSVIRSILVDLPALVAADTSPRPASQRLMVRPRDVTYLWALTFFNAALAVHQSSGSRKLALLEAFCNTLGAQADTDSAFLQTLMYPTAGDDPTSSSVTAMPLEQALLLHSFYYIKVVIAETQRRNSGSAEDKDVSVLVIAHLLRLFGDLFLLPVGPCNDDLLSANILEAEARTDRPLSTLLGNQSGSPALSLDVGEQNAEEDEPKEAAASVVKFTALAVKLASIELRISLDERMICPPGKVLDVTTRQRHDDLVPACLVILEKAIDCLLLLEDDDEDDLNTKARTTPHHTISFPRSTDDTRQSLAEAMASQSHEENLAWMTSLRDCFAAVLAYLEEMKERLGPTAMVKDPILVAVFRGLCFWLAQDLSLLKDHPAIIQVFSLIIDASARSADEYQTVLPFMAPPVRLWASIADEAGPTCPITPADRVKVLAMARQLESLDW